MIITETLVINGKEYTRRYSDLGVYIERDGEQYEEAIDPIDSGRVYIETEQPIVDESEVTDDDYQDALESLGVDFNA